jgi:hypothetical protein
MRPLATNVCGLTGEGEGEGGFTQEGEGGEGRGEVVEGDHEREVGGGGSDEPLLRLC